MKRTDPHPLESVALAAFRVETSHDAATLAPFLGGSSPAFVEVARDVLKHLVQQRRLSADPDSPGKFKLRVKGFTLAEEAWIRRGCRSCLKNLPVRLADGRVLKVLASRWNADSELEIQVQEGRPYISAELATVVGEWKVRCCRPLKSRMNEILATQEVGA